MVAQTNGFTGKVTPPVVGMAVMMPVAPTFTVATAKAPVPLVPGILTMPGSGAVAARATMSGIGVADAENASVFRPALIEAAAAFAHLNASCTSAGAIGTAGVIEKMYV